MRLQPPGEDSMTTQAASSGTTPGTAPSRHRVAVVICTFNRAGLLEKTLSSFLLLRVPHSLQWELLVVNNGSTDETESVCASFSNWLPLRVIVEREPGLSNARNRALWSVNADYLVYTDDDVIVDPGWLESFVDAAKRWPSASAFGGPVEPDFPIEPAPDLLAAFPVLATGFCGLDHHRPEGPLPTTLEVYGANMAYRVDAVAGLRFDPRLGHTPNSLRGGEETKFLADVRARGGDVLWCPNMRVKHYVDPSRMTLEYLVSYHEGRGEALVRSEGLPPAPAILGVPRWLWRKTIEAYGHYLLFLLTAKRVETLKRLRRCSVLRGMLRECWTSRDRGRTPATPRQNGRTAKASERMTELS